MNAYRVVVANTPSDLSDLVSTVNDLISQGYEPLGSLTPLGTVVVQTLYAPLAKPYRENAKSSSETVVVTTPVPASTKKNKSN